MYVNAILLHRMHFTKGQVFDRNILLRARLPDRQCYPARCGDNATTMFIFIRRTGDAWPHGS